MLADLYYNRYRDYDPTTGRYIQADPIGLAGGANGYLYAGGNPVNWVDPMGLVAVCNDSGRPVLVGGTVGAGHGHSKGRADRWGSALLANGQCVSARHPLLAKDASGLPCQIQDIDAIDLDGDGKVEPSRSDTLSGIWNYISPFGQNFRGGDAEGGWPGRDYHIRLFPFVGKRVDWLPWRGRNP